MEVQWYGDLKTIEYMTTTCLWHVVGYEPVPIRLVLLRDPKGKYESVSLMSTGVLLIPAAIIETFVSPRFRRNESFYYKAHIFYHIAQREFWTKSIAISTKTHSRLADVPVSTI